MIIIDEEELKNYSLFLDTEEETKNKIINEYILLYPHFVIDTEEKISYPSILHSIWFKENDQIYDLNIIYFKNKENQYYFNINLNNILLHGESKAPDLRFNSAINNRQITANKTKILSVMKKYLVSLGKKIIMENGYTYKTLKGKIKKEYEEQALNYFFKNKITDKKLVTYTNKLKDLYNTIYTKPLTDDNFKKTLFDINQYFLNNEILKDKSIKIIKENNNLEAMLERNIFKNRQLLVFGRHGIGKTYGIRKYIEKKGYELVSIQANNSIDDIYLKGHLMKDYDGNFKWKYGKLALAFKKASQGKKIVVFIDEFLRLPETTFDNLITAMDPYNGNYIYDTERPIKNSSIEEEDCMETEELLVPIENIWFVCSTNIGQDYNVEELELALKDRFILYYMNLTEKEKIGIINNILKSKKYTKYNDKIISFFKDINQLWSLGKLSNEVNVRHMSDIILMSDDEEDIINRLNDKILTWVDNDLKGIPLQNEVKIIKDLINKYFN